MKSGSGDDPFADEATSTDTEQPSDSKSDSDEVSTPPADSDSANGELGEPQANDATSGSDAASATADEGEDDSPAIPWVLRRSSVKADRPNVTQFFLRDETDRAERRFQSDVEDILDADVYTLDLREAAYLVAMRHPEEVAEELLDWGYEYME